MKSHRRLSLPENPANFLKVILSDDPQSTGIRIPKKFTEKHGTNLLERVILKVPNGDVWRVNLQKSGGEIWLTNGDWWEFAEHYGLKYGHLLLFKYEGFSTFCVVIFDTSASEIVYPPMKKDQLKNSTKEMAGKIPQEVKFTKLMTVKLEDETCSSSEDENPRVKINGLLNSLVPICFNKLDFIIVAGECSRMRNGDERRAVERAKADFKSHKPFFVVYIHESYVIRKRGVHVPIKFRRKYWTGCKKGSKYLLKLANDERQKTWEVLADEVYLGNADWLRFVKDNGITIGDICVFELIQEHKNVFEVTIVRSKT